MAVLTRPEDLTVTPGSLLSAGAGSPQLFEKEKFL